MRRRELLALLGGAGAGITGWAGLADTAASGGNETTPDGSGRRLQSDPELPIPRSELNGSLPRDRIPAIVDPAFAPDWDGGDGDGPRTTPDGGLSESAPVIGVERGGRARAYPLAVLHRHEVVNDRFDGPLLVTYCPLCGSGMVAERRVGATATTFGVSGFLWRSDLVLYDRRTHSLWSQLLATAIRGPRTGDELALVPSTLTTWGAWREAYPGTRVLLPPPASNTLRGRGATFEYTNVPPRSGTESGIIGTDPADGELAPRTLVIGVAAGGEARAYPYPVVADAGIVNDAVGDRPVVVSTAPGRSLVAYDRRVEGRLLEFGTDRTFLTAGGSRWDPTDGRAIDGPYAGHRLDRANDYSPLFWVGWYRFYPESDVYGRYQFE